MKLPILENRGGCVTFEKMFPVGKRWIWWLLLILPSTSMAQPDSLMRQFEGIKNLAVKADSMGKVAYSLRRKQPKAALELAREALKVSQQAKVESVEVDVLLVLGQLTKDHYPAEEALPFVRKATDKAKALNIAKLYTDGLRDLGALMDELGKPDSALHYLLLSEKICAENGLHYDKIYSYIGISQVYDHSRDLKNSEVYLLKALEISEKKKLRRDYGYILYSLVVLYREMGELEKYSTFGEKYLQFLAERQEPRKPDDLSHYSFLTAFPELKKADAIREMENTLPVHQRLGNLRILNEAYYNLGTLASEEGDWKKAAAFFASGVQVTDRIGLPVHKMEMLLLAHKANRKAGNPELALSQLEMYLHLSDSLKTEQSRKNLEELSVKYETEKKERQIEIQQLQLEKERQTRLMLLGGLGIAAVLAAVVSFSLFQQNRLNKVLAEKNAVIEDSLRQRELLLKEIHHRVKNNLQMVSSLLRLQSRFVNDPEALKALQEGQERVKSVALIHEHLYQPGDLNTVFMPTYLANLVDRIAASFTDPAGNLRILKQVDDLSMHIEQAIPLGLIVNELVTNAFKHAFPEKKSGEVRLSLRKTQDFIRLEVTDNGKGMETKQDDTSFGFELIRTLTAKLGGNLEISGSHGSSVSILAPISSFS